MLPGVIRAVRISGLSIPTDISLVAALDTDLTEMLDPPISVEDWDYAEVGRLAARFVLARIRDGFEGAPKRVTCPTKFIMRESISTASR
jgi:LacI family transcriptional regulator